MLLKSRFAKVAVFVLCLVPVAWLAFAAFTGKLSANPIRDITEDTGAWALRFLLLTLCVTPFRKLTGWNEVIRYRRMLGLYAFFYGFLHFLTYACLDQSFSIPAVNIGQARTRQAIGAYLIKGSGPALVCSISHSPRSQ